MGTPDFALTVLRALHEADHHIVQVITQPPRPCGRGYKLKKSPVHNYALENSLPIATPASLKCGHVQSDIRALKPDFLVVAAYGLIIPRMILDIPLYGSVNVHPSLLPRWRGAAPLQRTLLAGDVQTGVTLLQMDEGVDTGPIISQEPFLIHGHYSCEDLGNLLAHQGAFLLVRFFNTPTQHPRTVPQPVEGATYASKILREEGRLRWNCAAYLLSRCVRALNPWPGTWFIFQEKRIKVLEAMTCRHNDALFSSGDALEPNAPPTNVSPTNVSPTNVSPTNVSHKKTVPGTVLPGMWIQCKEGRFRPTIVMPEGGKKMPIDDFIRGHPVPVGTLLP